MSRIVAALGGNALGHDPDTQLKNVDIAADIISEMVVMGHDVLVTHGNGPQVGMIMTAFSHGYHDHITPNMPLAESIAMSQGYIGYHLQQAIDEQLMRKGSNKPVITMLTQVIVDENDPAFQNPTKPIGDFFDEDTFVKLQAETNDRYKKFPQGYRKIVPSPKPKKIYETVTLDVLLNAGQVVIACGGGGIPVIQTSKGYRGISAVIDKDLAAAKLADHVHADYLFIMTDTPYVALDFGTKNQLNLRHLPIAQARQYIKENQFPEGSMLPKIEAAIEFVEDKPSRRAIICNLCNAITALLGESGTQIFDI